MPTPPAPHGEIVLVDGFLFTAWRNVLVSLCFQAPTVPSFAALERSTRALGRDFPDGTYGLVVLQPHAPVTDPRVLWRMREMMQAIRATQRQTFMVFQLEGLWSQLVRAMVRNAGVMSGLAGGTQFHVNIEEAIRALAPKVQAPQGDAAAQEQLRSVVAALLSRWRAAAAPEARRTGA